MGKKGRERNFAAWRDDVDMFRRWHQFKHAPTDARLRELYDDGYGTEQAARQLCEDEKIKEINDADNR